MNPITRHPSWSLCRELAGSHQGGNVGDLADIIAQAIEWAEAPTKYVPLDPHSINDAQQAISRIRGILDRAEQRLRELAS